MTNINFWRNLRRTTLIWLIGLMTLLSGWFNVLFEGEVYPYKSVDRAVGLEALERSQGVTTDGVSWIFSGKTSLVRVSFDNETILALNRKAIPDAFKSDFGSKHIGGVSYCDGYVYAAVEDSKVWAHPVVALYDADTLAFTGRFVELPGKDSGSAQALTHGVPWVACDAQEGVFYVAQCDDASELYAYDLETFAFVRSISLDTPVDDIQGGEMYKGYLYVATNDKTRAVYRIDVRRGTVEHYFDRILSYSSRIANFGGEGEDMTVLPMSDGTLFHALNIGALFIDANLRHYEPVPGKPLEAEKDPDVPPAQTPLTITQEQLYTFGSASSSFRKVIATDDGGYLALGWFHYAVGDYADTRADWNELRSSLVKYDQNGEYAWKICFGSKKTDQGVWLQDVAQLSDGSYAAVGYTDAKDFPERTDKTTADFDVVIVRVSSSGELIWRKLLYGTGHEMAYSVAATPDGGFVTGLRTDSSDGAFEGLTEGVHKAVLQKMDADGAAVWRKALNSGSLAAIIPAITVSDDGTIYAAYYAAADSALQMDMAELAGYGGADSIIIKYSADGEMLRHRAIAGSGADEVKCIALVPDGGVIVGGSFTKNTRDDSVFAGTENMGRADAFLVRLDENLNVLWVRTFGGDQKDRITGVAAVKGGFVFCGATMSEGGAFDFLGSGKNDAFVMTVTSSGADTQTYAIGSTNDDEAMGIVATGDRSVIVAGLTHGADDHFAGTEPAGANSRSVSFLEKLRIG